MSVILETHDLKKYFKTPRGMLHAVDGISVQVEKGTTLGVVGESGCGKSTMGKTLLLLEKPTSGEIIFEGKPISQVKTKRELAAVRKDIQMIFQDPYSSLNPRMRVCELIAEPIKINGICHSKAETDALVRKLMEDVGLAERYYNAYPHELDGGRRQRIGIARALSVNPKVIVCDEPVSALDVSVQAQILNLLMDLQKERELTYVFITHDLSVVKHISNRIMVMYLGQCVEEAPSSELFANPLHPYTQALLSAILTPTVDMHEKEINIIKGELSNPINPMPGCRFAARCPYRTEACKNKVIPVTKTNNNHSVVCTRFL